MLHIPQICYGVQNYVNKMFENSNSMDVYHKNTFYKTNLINIDIYSPINPLEVDINDVSSMSLYSGPISIRTFLNEWNADPLA